MDHWHRPGLHWHCYTWVGGRRPEDTERRPPAFQNGARSVWHSPAPPLEVMHWLAKPASQIGHTTDDPADALAWLGKQLAEAPALDTDLSPALRLKHADAFLRTYPHDVVWNYWTPGRQLRATAAVSCPRIHSPTSEPPPPCPGRQR
ncbi:hypothetical protein ACWC5I_17720 [Kitasatospora sp. NPDC001574]